MAPRSARRPPRRPKEGPRGAPGRPRWPQDGPKIVTRWLQMAPGGRKMRPAWPYVGEVRGSCHQERQFKKTFTNLRKINVFERYGTPRMAQDGAKSGPSWPNLGLDGLTTSVKWATCQRPRREHRGSLLRGQFLDRSGPGTPDPGPRVPPKSPNSPGPPAPVYVHILLHPI